MTNQRFEIEGDLAYVPLTKGYTAIIDVESIPLIDKYKWYANKANNSVYAVTAIRDSSEKQRKLGMHRIIAKTPDHLYTDHINGNGLDNRKANLRFATNAENLRNQGARVNNKSGYKGVYWGKQSKRWEAKIAAFGKIYFLGRFDTPQEAHIHYCKAAKRLHGAFAKGE